MALFTAVAMAMEVVLVSSTRNIYAQGQTHVTIGTSETGKSMPTLKVINVDERVMHEIRQAALSCHQSIHDFVIDTAGARVYPRRPGSAGSDQTTAD